MTGLQYDTITTKEGYTELLNQLYVKVKTTPSEIVVPKINIIAVDGNEPPGSKQYQEAISALYGIGYTLSMGLKFKKLPKPEGYYDYKTGGLETLWWSITGKELDINDSGTLRWKAYLMVPAFISNGLFESAREQALAKHPEIKYSQVNLEEFNEGHSVQLLHIGPYDQEKTSVDKIMIYMSENNLEVNGHHHEIYISDPRRTKPEKLKTVIRYPVKAKK